MYNKSPSYVLSQLHTNQDSWLDESQVLLQRDQYGRNRLPSQKKISLWSLFLNQFADSIVWILLWVSLVSFLLHEYIDGSVILGIVLLNALFGCYQEYKAEQGMEALIKNTIIQAKVLRWGVMSMVNSEDLVVGDIVLMEAWDRVVADMRLLVTNECFVDESLLTGESTPVNKNAECILWEHTPLADQVTMAWSGSNVTQWTAKGLVVAVGVATQLGKVVDLIASKKEQATPLQQKLTTFSKQIALIILLISTIISLIAWYQWKPLIETIFIIISLAVSSIPEWLVAVVTITLAFSAKQLFKQNALVRRIRSIESLGMSTVICTDKTGTLTQNKMTVTQLRTTDALSQKDHNSIFTWYTNQSFSAYTRIYEVMNYCNNASLPNVGDPTEIALLEYVAKIAIGWFVRHNEIPFNSQSKYMIVSGLQWWSQHISYIKWSLEYMLDLCRWYQVDDQIKPLTDLEKDRILKQNSDYSAQAIRVLWCGYCLEETTHDHLPQFVFVGMVWMIDPPRVEVAQAIKDCYKAGIKVIMITGDHLLTAQAIAHQIGLEGKAIEWVAFQRSSSQLTILKDTTIFARVSPEQKVLICEWLKKLGHHVVMTGDGVNDAAALKAADIGFAMGITGTQVTKDASDIVLLDDNFATIVSTIAQGRTVYDNIKKFIVFMLAVNFDEMIRVIFSFLVGRPVPMTAIQILWINLVTDSFPALGLGFDKSDGDSMNQKPRSAQEWILQGQRWKIVVASLLASSIGIWLFYYNLTTEGLEVARTVSVTSAVCFEMFLIYSFRHPAKQSRTLPSNRFLNWSVFVVLLLQITIIYSPLWKYFDFVPLSWEDVILCFVTGSVWWIGFEAWKRIRKIS